MNWLKSLFLSRRRFSDELIKSIQEKFEHFLKILDCNYRVLKIISDMEEKSQGEYLFDMSYIQNSRTEINEGMEQLIAELNILSGDRYRALRDRYREINHELDMLMAGGAAIEKDDYVVPFDMLGRERAFSVGSKNAQLGELKTNLGLPVPDGFAISAWAYKRFVEANYLQEKITDKLSRIDIKSYSDLVAIGNEIRAMVMASEIPSDLSDAIAAAFVELKKRNPSAKIAMRSSAIGEDTLFSFAGQYQSLLNVPPEKALDGYRSIIASKFTPQAIYYYLSHSLAESNLAMSVGCTVMIDAAAAGVIYTRDPVNSESDTILVSSIFGLGKYLVDGTLTPDTFLLSRNDGRIVRSQISTKAVCLRMSPDGGTVEEPVPAERQNLPSLQDAQLKRIAEYALKIENHYRTPQDIEWAIGTNGQIYILQSRPLQILRSKPTTRPVDINLFRQLASGGMTVCPGAGAGPVYKASSASDLAAVPDGSVLMAAHPFPGLITIMEKVSAIVTSVGSLASHMATLAREYRVPTIAGMQNLERFGNGDLVTVDATECVIYADIQNDLVEARKPEFDFFEDIGIFLILRQMLDRIAPLNLIGRGDTVFKPENCRTLHDITRFAHQKAMEEMFSRILRIDNQNYLGVTLKSKIPLKLTIIYIDRDISQMAPKGFITEEQIDSAPMRSFWAGVMKVGWPSAPPPVDFKGFAGVLGTTLSRSEEAGFSENSFAILSRNYMLLSLRMGFHFSTIEAMCSEEISKNYIRMHFKDGGASLDRRIRRIRLITEVLSRVGFECHSRADFLDTVVSYLDCDMIASLLYQLGRVTILTKQLDMALSSDEVTLWYTHDILKKLGIEPQSGETK